MHCLTCGTRQFGVIRVLQAFSTGSSFCAVSWCALVGRRAISSMAGHADRIRQYSMRRVEADADPRSGEERVLPSMQ